MPIYTLTTQEGTLSADQKKVIADEVTSIHANATGAPKSHVRVFFNVYPKGDAFSGGEASAVTLLFAQIRGGRDITTKQNILKQYFDLVQKVGGIPKDQILAALVDVPPNQMMRLGAILPDPIREREVEWLDAHSE